MAKDSHLMRLFYNFFKGIWYVFVGIRYISNRCIYLTNIFISYFGGGECSKFKDCVLLNKLIKNMPPNSDRFLEYPWAIKNITLKEGKLLDVGSTAASMFRSLVPAGVEVYAVDLNGRFIPKNGVNFSVADIRKTNFPDDYFDCISCISTLEHIGVSGRYNSDNDPTGDSSAMKEMRRTLKNGGRLLLTVPYGIKDVLPINKLYNSQRLKALLQDFVVIEKVFLKFDNKWGLWLEVDEAEAAKTDMINDRWYSLCLINAVKQ